jgi:hypothetical protein
MSFYITLPSNGADLNTEEDLKNNTKTDFEIKLNSPLEFRNIEYEVALVEIWFPFNWKINFGNIKILYARNPNSSETEIFNKDIIYFDGTDIKSLIFHINSLLNENNILNVGKSFEFLHDFKKINFNLTEKNTLVILSSSKFRIIINGFLLQLFKNPRVLLKNIGDMGDSILNINVFKEFNNTIEIQGTEEINIEFKNINEIVKITDEIYVYTDIIEYQYVGQQMGQLLRLVTVNNSQNNLCHIMYTDPHYLNLINNKISSIRLFMRDGFGNKIQFLNQNSSVIYKLQFRPKQKIMYKYIKNTI